MNNHLATLTHEQEQFLIACPVRERSVASKSAAWAAIILEQLGFIQLTNVLSKQNARYELTELGKGAKR